jgi:hypothetical protein
MAALVWMGCKGGLGPTYRAAANLGVRTWVWKAGVDFAGDHGRAVARGKTKLLGGLGWSAAETGTRASAFAPA